jgi:hypothetical protein
VRDLPDGNPIALCRQTLQPLLAGRSSKRQHAAIETLTVLADALEETTTSPARATVRRATRARALAGP